MIIYNKSREPIESAVLCREDSVYLLNLLIVFTTDEPLDMLLNMLALEFILQAPS